MQRVGYEYVIVDDCWQGKRDGDGFIQPDGVRFPSGMKALVDYVHGKGLKFGLHSGAGATTCADQLGSRGHEYQDALQYARWGIDYLGYDRCNAEALDPKGAFTTLHDALESSRRPVVLGLREWGARESGPRTTPVAHLWRTGEVAACFDCVLDYGTGNSLGVLPQTDAQKGTRAFAGPGHWNDPGLLQIGTTMTEAEDRAQLSLWAMLAAPLVCSNDLTSMTEATRKLLTNPETIAVDQDNLGIQGFRYRTDGELELWVRPLSRGQLALLFLNRGRSAREVSFDWAKNEIRDDLTHRHYDLTETVYEVRDLWAHEHLGTTNRPLSTTLQRHDVLMLRLTPQK